jgi:hypothetical protein
MKQVPAASKGQGPEQLSRAEFEARFRVRFFDPEFQELMEVPWDGYVSWYLNAMIDRPVFADGGNPDPTSTHGKKAEEAKALEPKSWDYPKHLAGRSYSVIVHGDSAGAENLRRSLCD